MPFCGPGWRWVVTKMEVKHKYKDLNLVETWPRWRGDINLGAWLEVRYKSWDLAEGEMGHGLSWDSHIETWKSNGNTSKIQLSWPGLRWDVTWIVVGCEYRDLDGRNKGESEMLIFVPRWNLDGAWMEVTQESWDLNAGDAGSGWRWDTDLETWIALRWDLEGADRVPSRGGFGGLNPHQNHLDPHFIWPWVQWTLCIDLSQAGSNFSYGVLKSLVCWWPHSSFVLYNVIRKYNICSRIKCQLGTCAQHPASTPERVGLLLQMKTK